MVRFTTFAAIVLVALVAACRPSEESQARSPRGFALPEGDAQRGQEAFLELRCTTCHLVAGFEDEFPRPTATPMVDVKLGGLAMRQPTDGELVTSIINPSHRIFPGSEEQEKLVSGSESRMANLREVMTVQQLLDLVTFLHDRYETIRSQQP